MTLRRRDLFLLSLLSAIPALGQEAQNAVPVRPQRTGGAPSAPAVPAREDAPSNSQVGPDDSRYAVARDEDGNLFKPTWREVADCRVRVEGISWGARFKGLPHIVVRDAQVGLYFPKDFDEKSWEDGRLVRVEGVLIRTVVPPPQDPMRQQRGAGVFYAVAATRVEYVQKVDYPGVQVLDRIKNPQ